MFILQLGIIFQTNKMVYLYKMFSIDFENTNICCFPCQKIRLDKPSAKRDSQIPEMIGTFRQNVITVNKKQKDKSQR